MRMTVEDSHTQSEAAVGHKHAAEEADMNIDHGAEGCVAGTSTSSSKALVDSIETQVLKATKLA